MAVRDLKLFGPSGYLLGESAWGPASIAGPDKVAQRFLYALLTPAGSVPGRPRDGTEFFLAVRTFRSDFDLVVAFATAEPIAAQCVRAAETADDADSERYGYAELVRVQIDADELALTFAVGAADGSIPAEPVVVTLEL